jgi:O-methyltransferase
MDMKVDSIKNLIYRLRDPALVMSYAFWQLAKAYDLLSPTRFSRLYRQVSDITMCSNARLRGLYKAVKYVVETNVPGDVVECGTARGGSAALMGLTLKELPAADRKLWVFDTFEGLPPPTRDDPDFDIAALYTGSCFGSLEDVTASFSRLDIAHRTTFVKGLFQDTLAKADVRQIAVLHIDGDWYDSVTTCLENLYDKVSPNGVVQIDDYGYWKGARKAVHEFFDRRSIAPELLRLDHSGRQFIKPPYT